MTAKFVKSVAGLFLGLGMLTANVAAVAQYGPPPRSAPGWDAPPPELRDFQRRGYADGVQGAQRDYENHRRWDVNNRDEYRHPNVPGRARRDYREGFKRGYYATVRHFQGGRGPGPR
jgi:hypothetical protein